MMPHPTMRYMVGALRRQDRFVIAEGERRAMAAVAPALPRRALAVLIATVTANAVLQATMPASSFAASHVNIFSTDIPRATEEILTTGTHEYRPAGSVRTVAQLMVPAGAHWETPVSRGSLLLTLASGALQVAIRDGTAWIVHRSGADTHHELTPDDSVVLVAGDRLVMNGGGSLVTGNVSQDPVIAAVIRVR